MAECSEEEEEKNEEEVEEEEEEEEEEEDQYDEDDDDEYDEEGDDVFDPEPMEPSKKERLKRRNTPMFGLFSPLRKPNSKAELTLPGKQEGLLIIGESEECEDEDDS